MLKKIRKMLKQQEGFTLVELMIVVVILGILAGIGIQQYGNVQQKAKDAAHAANIKIIRSATNMYLMVNNPTGDTDPAVTDIDLADIIAANYLDAAPTNPNTDAKDYDVTVSLGAGGQYVVKVFANEVEVTD